MDPIAPDEFVAAVRGTPFGAACRTSITGVSIDSRAIRMGDAFFAIPGARFDGHDFVESVAGAGAAMIVISRRGMVARAQQHDWPVVFVDDTVAALGRLAQWYRRTLPAKIVAVTGSNGKTTTKRMLEAVLARLGQVISAPKSFNNNIGVPLTLLSADKAHPYIILELGTNHPGEIQELAALGRPDLAVITSIGEAHVEHLGGLDGVAREKASLLEALPAHGGFAAVNIDQPAILPYLRGFAGTLVRFGFSKDADLRAEAVECSDSGMRFRVNGRWPVQLAMLGRHNASNALGAWAVGVRLGLAPEQIAEALSAANPPEMRLERMTFGPITLLNDAYNANPASVGAALRTLADMPIGSPGRRVAVLADMLELGEQSKDLHAATGRLLAEAGGIECLVAVGADAQHLADAAQAAAPSLRVQRFADAEQAARGIGAVLRPGDIVLLKGSRGMQMEKLVPAVEAFGTSAGAARPQAERDGRWQARRTRL